MKKEFYLLRVIRTVYVYLPPRFFSELNTIGHHPVIRECYWFEAPIENGPFDIKLLQFTISSLLLDWRSKGHCPTTYTKKIFNLREASRIKRVCRVA